MTALALLVLYVAALVLAIAAVNAGRAGSGTSPARAGLGAGPARPGPLVPLGSKDQPAEYWHDQYLAELKRSARRLAGWRRMERSRNALRAVMRLRAARAAWNGLVCIHGYEGAWNDPNPPFWGGLQMDAGFQWAYGAPIRRRLGTADHWPPELQLAVGLIAYYSGRGFGPWPNTRKSCGI